MNPLQMPSLLPYLMRGGMNASPAYGAPGGQGSPRPPRRDLDPATNPIVAALNPQPVGLNDSPPFGGMSSSQLGDRMTSELGAPLPSNDFDVTMPRKPKAFGKDGVGWKILGVIGDAMAGYAGRPPLFTQGLLDQREQQARLDAEMYQPRVVGRKLVQMGEDGTMRTLFEGEPDYAPFERYALALGMQPGTPEYQQAVQDYRLGGWSDPAMENKTELEGVRYGYRDRLQDDRLDVTRRGQDLRATTTRRGQDLTHGDRVRGQNIGRENNIRSNDTRRGAASYSNPGKGGNGPRAVAADGRPIVVKGGRWVYEADGRPVQ